MTGNRVLWDLDAQSVNALLRCAQHPPGSLRRPDAFRTQRLQATSDRS
jgi:hypothetical protein